MKNKIMVYLLGVVVAIVWGIIIWRIVVAAGGSDDNVLIIPEKIQKEAYNDFKPIQDTSHLLLNYRDPFGLEKPKDTMEKSKKKMSHKTVLASVKSVVNWGLIKYSGYIRNPASKKTIALLIINGKNVTLAEGETAGNVKLLKNMRDSIKINFNGQVKFITMNPKAI